MWYRSGADFHPTTRSLLNLTSYRGLHLGRHVVKVINKKDKLAIRDLSDDLLHAMSLAGDA